MCGSSTWITFSEPPAGPGCRGGSARPALGRGSRAGSGGSAREPRVPASPKGKESAAVDEPAARAGAKRSVRSEELRRADVRRAEIGPRLGDVGLIGGAEQGEEVLGVIGVGGDAIRIREGRRRGSPGPPARWSRRPSCALRNQSECLCRAAKLREALGVDLPLRVRAARRAGARRRRSAPPASSSRPSGSGMSGLAAKVKSTIGDVNRNSPATPARRGRGSAEAARGLEAQVEEHGSDQARGRDHDPQRRPRRPAEGDGLPAEQRDEQPDPGQMHPAAQRRARPGRRAAPPPAAGRAAPGRAGRARTTMSQPSIFTSGKAKVLRCSAVEDRLGDGQRGKPEQLGGRRTPPPGAPAQPDRRVTRRRGATRGLSFPGSPRSPAYPLRKPAGGRSGREDLQLVRPGMEGRGRDQ